MTPVESAPLTDAAVTQRARLHTMLQRRKRLWRRIAILAVVTTGMVLMSLRNRDTEHLRTHRRLGEMIAAALQKELEDRRRPPLMFPTGKDPREDELAREIGELNWEINRLEDAEAGSGPDLAELERKREDVGERLNRMVSTREQFERERQRHYFNFFYVNQQRLSPETPAGVCCPKKPVRFFLQSEGRMVILFDGENFTAQWMPEHEFRAEAEQLGFEDLLGE